MNTPSDQIDAWVERHGPQLVLFARQWVPEMADAEDVVQEAFVRFWPRRSRARQPVAYLFQCVRNTAQNWNRSHGRRRHYQEQMDATPWFADGESPLELSETNTMIETALQALPIEQREVVVMHIWGRLTFAEISTAVNIPLATAQSRYRYAMRKLRGILEQVYGDG